VVVAVLKLMKVQHLVVEELVVEELVEIIQME
jgi:hypothetical protein